MNYKKIYDQIIEKRKLEEPQDGYIEVHHIVPASLGGSNNKENLVALTAREHFMCHCLLAKMYEKESLEWYKMNHAFMMMKCTNLLQDRYFNSRLYEALRGNFSSIMSFAQSGSKNSNYGNMWISHIDDKISKLIKKDDVIPEGWIKGRNAWNKKLHLKKIKNHKCLECGCDIPKYNKYCIDHRYSRNKKQAIKILEYKDQFFQMLSKNEHESCYKTLKLFGVHPNNARYNSILRRWIVEYESLYPNWQRE